MQAGNGSFDADRLFHDLGAAYDRHIVNAHKQDQVLILVTFLLTFIVVRIITHAIRAGRWRRVFRNVQTSGGMHLHHLVPGIFLLLASGYLGIGLPPDVSRAPIAVMFGVGAALTLDEFALWLHLKDVYWSREGRQSIDAVVIAASVASMIILGWSFWLDIGRALGRFTGIS
jgi:hypothetical protein